jgi:hypothetical protein
VKDGYFAPGGPAAVTENYLGFTEKELIGHVLKKWWVWRQATGVQTCSSMLITLEKYQSHYNNAKHLGAVLLLIAKEVCIRFRFYVTI